MTAMIETPDCGVACGCDRGCDYLHTADGAKLRIVRDETMILDYNPEASRPWQVDVIRRVGDDLAYTQWVHNFRTREAAVDFVSSVRRGTGTDWVLIARGDLARELGVTR